MSKIRFARIGSAPLVSLVLALTMASCLAPGARDDAEDLAAQSRLSDIVPSFAPAQDSSTAPSNPGPPTPNVDDPTPGDTTASPHDAEPDTAPDDDGSDAASPTPRSVASTPSDTGPGPTVTQSSAVDDAEGDVTASVLEEAPPYADLLGARVELGDAGYEIVITVGGDVPEQQPDPDRTMNVAWFADVDGDGAVDHEIWLNLADDGWFPGHRDNRRSEARFGGETGIEVAVDGRSLVLRFADDLLGAERFRWAVGSEWGRYEVLGTDAAARDSAPEGHASIDHPA